MVENPSSPTPPYTTFSFFVNFMNKLREGGMPSRIDASVFGRASGSAAYSTIAALKSLNLIDANGIPTQKFNDLVMADDTERKPLMQNIIKDGYPTLWNDSVNLKTITAGQFDEHIRQQYGAKGSTVDKIATFFLSAAKYAEIPISPHLADRKPTASSTTSTKSKRQRRAYDDETTGDQTPFIDPQIPMSDKALEYKLVDLMKDAEIADEQRTAIWTLIQYLTAKYKKKIVE